MKEVICTMANYKTNCIYAIDGEQSRLLVCQYCGWNKANLDKIREHVKRHGYLHSRKTGLTWISYSLKPHKRKDGAND